MQSLYTLPQLFGWLGLIVFIISFFVTHPRKTIAIWIPGNIAYALHFFLLNSNVAMMTAIMATVRDVSAVTFSDRIFHKILIISIGSIWFVAIMFKDNWYDIFPAFGTTFMGLSTFYRGDFLKHRIFAYLHQLSWLAFGAFILSYPLIIQSCVLFMANSIGIYRKYKRTRA